MLVPQRERGGIGMRSGLKSRWSLTVGVRLPSLPFNLSNQWEVLQSPQLDHNQHLPITLGASSEHDL